MCWNMAAALVVTLAWSPQAFQLGQPLRGTSSHFRCYMQGGEEVQPQSLMLPQRFPTIETPPSEVLESQLQALRTGDIPCVYRLFSRARKLIFEDGCRMDLRDARVKPERIHSAVATVLVSSCPGLLGHHSSEVVASLCDPAPEPGLLPKWTFRVKVRTSMDLNRHYFFTLTRQSPFDGGDPRDCDGFERCWFVWSITLDDDRGGSERLEEAPTPTLLPA